MTSRTSEQSIFLRAIELDSPAARSDFLDEVCRNDAALRAEVEALLLAHDRLGGTPASWESETGSPPSSRRPGDRIDSYRLVEAIGEGGMGTVYVAEQTRPVRREVALKVIKPGMDSMQVIARFETERQALAMMDHPNIARVFDGGSDPVGRPYFVMELVRGLPITEYCDQERLSITERLELFVLVCRAVQHAHQKGIIHRDLKPSNVLVTLQDGVPVPKIIDFGVAKALDQPLVEGTVFTSVLQMVGTPLYMSPEQAGLYPDIDTRADIYSLGVLLYELLTGVTPFDAETMKKAAFDEMRRMIREVDPPTPSSRLSRVAGPQVPDSIATVADRRSSVAASRNTEPSRLTKSLRGELDWIVMKCLEKDRARRYETANGLARDLRRYLEGETIEACPPSRLYRLRKFARRNRVVLGTTVLVGMALIAGTVVSAWQAIRAVRAERRTAQALGTARDALEVARERTELAREAVDEMYSEVASSWLSNQARMEPLQERFLLKALGFYEKFARQPGDDPRILLKAAQAYRRVGDITWRLGRRGESIAAFRSAISILERLAVLARTNSESMLELAFCETKLGWNISDTGNPEAGLVHHRRAVAVLRELVARSPEDRKARVNLATATSDLSAALYNVGRYREMGEAARQSIAEGDRLIQANPDDRGALYGLALAWENLGESLEFTGRWRESEMARRKSLELRSTLLRASPASRSYRHSHAKACYRLAVLAFRAGRLDEADRLRREHEKAERRLVADFPESYWYLEEVGGSVRFRARWLEATGNLPAAIEACRESLKIADELVQRFPEVHFHRRELGLTWFELGRYLWDLGQPVTARDAFARALEVLDQAHTNAPRDHVNKLALAKFLVFCPDEAFRNPWRAAELAAEGVKLAPEHAELWSVLGIAHFRLGDPRAAIDCLEESLRCREGGTPQDWYALAMVHASLGEPDEAARWFQKAVEWTDSKAPRDGDLRRLRVETAARLGLLGDDQPMPNGPAAFRHANTERPSPE